MIKKRKAPLARSPPKFVSLSMLPAAGGAKKKEHVKSARKGDVASQKSIKEIGVDVLIDIPADGEALNDKRGDNADENHGMND